MELRRLVRVAFSSSALLIAFDGLRRLFVIRRGRPTPDEHVRTKVRTIRSDHGSAFHPSLREQSMIGAERLEDWPET